MAAARKALKLRQISLKNIVVARTGEERGVHRLLVGKPEGKRPLGIPRRRWEVNIKMDLKEVGRGGTGWS
jgi:hypothetical protein